MTTHRPINNFRGSIRTDASPAAVYDALTHLATHMRWAGEQTGDKKFRLLTLDAPAESATIGTRFSSTGVVMMGTFRDQSTVVEAVHGLRFGFDTDSRLERKHRTDWRGTFHHRYTLEPEGDGTLITYTCEMYVQNYVPWWWKPVARSMTRAMVGRPIRNSLRSLGALAGSAGNGARTADATAGAATVG